MKPNSITFDSVIRTLTAVVALVGAYLLIRRLSDVLVPFLVAWLIAYLLYPIVCFFQYRCRLRSRALSIVVTIVLLLAVVGGCCWLIVPPVIEEMGRLKDIIVSYVTTGTTVTTFATEVEMFVKRHVDLNEIIKALTINDISQIVEERVPQFFRLITNSVNALIGVICSFIAVIYLFFILSDYEKMARGLFNLVPTQHRELIRGIAKDVEDGMNSYFRGQSIVALLVGILFSCGFLLIDFPMAIPLGLFIGFLNLVPYLQVVGFLPTIVLGLLKAHDTGESFWGIMLAAIIVFCVVQAIQDWVLVPRIMGKVTGLNAAVILLSLSIWGSLLGFIGLIIALPLTTLVLSYYKRYVLREGAEESLE